MKFILLPVFFLITQSAFSQLSVHQNTYWKSSGNVYTVLADVDLNNNGALEIDNGTFKFTGKGDNVIKGTEKIIFYDVVLEKPTSKKIVLARDIGITHGLLFSSGLMDLGNFDIDLASTGQLKGEMESSRIIGDGDGQIITNAFLNAPAGVDPGNLGAVLTSSQNLGLVTIRRGHQSQTNASGAGNSILRYYDIEPANNSSLNATLRLHYFDAELNGMNEGLLTQWRKGVGSTWKNEGFTSRDVTTDYVEKSGIHAFSRWTLSSPGNPLPVTSLWLSGQWKKNNTAQLSWKTQAEYNNSHFELERKYLNENDFVVVGQKSSAHDDGNSLFPTFYEWIDANAKPAGMYYRLRQVDLDGSFFYSNHIFIQPGRSADFIEKLFPTFNTKQSIYIKAGNMNREKMTVSIVDISGQLVMMKQLNYASQWLQLPSLPAGTYLVKIASGNLQFQSAFIKQ